MAGAGLEHPHSVVVIRMSAPSGSTSRRPSGSSRPRPKGIVRRPGSAATAAGSRRRTARIRARSSRGSKGLTMWSSAPAASPASRWSSPSRPVGNGSPSGPGGRGWRARTRSLPADRCRAGRERTDRSRAWRAGRRRRPPPRPRSPVRRDTRRAAHAGPVRSRRRATAALPDRALRPRPSDLSGPAAAGRAPTPSYTGRIRIAIRCSRSRA